MSTDTNTSQLIINKLTKAQYEAITSPSDTELYLTPDTTAQDISDAVSTHNSSASAHSSLFNAKQDTLTAGSNIQITNNVISATDTTYTGGTNISIGSDNSINFTGSIPTKTSDLTNDSGFITGITYNDVTTALGYTPYDSSNPQGYTSNVGTITGITMNGSSKGTSGVVDLGTVITSHQSLADYVKSEDLGTMAYADTVTNGDISGTINQDKITNLSTSLAAKQDTLVSGTNIKTINSNSILGSGNLDIDALPSQSGQSGKYLTTDGSTASWATIQQAPEVDDETISLNSSDELQAIGVIDSRDSSTALKYWTGTSAQYEAITTKDSNTLYNITDDTDITLTLLQTIYPVGSIYITTNSTCPLAALFGTWTLVGADRVLQGAGTRGNVGTTIEESLPNIRASLALHAGEQANIIANETGAMAGYGGSTTQYRTLDTLSIISGAQSYGCIDFSATRSSSIYQDNAPVQPDAYVVNIYRRTA